MIRKSPVWKLLALAALSAAVTAGCKSNPNAAIEKAIQQHLSERTDLSIGQMVMELKQVNVNGEEAQADVVFRTTGSPPAQMAYTYMLRKEGGSWKVQSGRPTSMESGHPRSGDSGEQGGMGELPPGHPALPEGHPPIPEGSQMPDGHPPIDSRTNLDRMNPHE